MAEPRPRPGRRWPSAASARSAASQPNAPSATTTRTVGQQLELARRGTARRCRAPRERLVVAAARSGRPPRCTRRSSVRPSSARRLDGRSARPARVERGQQEVAGRVAGEDAAGPVAAVGRRRQARRSGSARRGRRSRARAGPSTARRGSARPSRAATRSRHSTRRGQRRQSTISAVSAASGRPVASRRPRRAYLSSSLSSRRDMTTSPMRPMTARYATWTSRLRRDAPTVSDADQVHAVVQRRQLDDDPERRRVGRRAGRTCPRTGTSAGSTSWIRSKSCHVRMNDVAAMPTAANAKPISSAAGSASIDPRRADEPEDDHHAQEPDRVQPAADERPDELAERDVAGRQRRRQDRRRTSCRS